MTGSHRPRTAKSSGSGVIPMRHTFVRLAALTGAIALVAGCDTRMPTATTIPTAGSPSSQTSSNTGKPTVTIDAPLADALINVGDSVLVTIHLQDPKALKTASIEGITERGSVDLGTYRQTPRYKLVTVPATGVFRSGLRDTTIHRYIQPINPADTSIDSLRIIAIAIDSVGKADTATRVINMVAGPKVSVVSPTN